MKLYLSSYKRGDEPERLVGLFSENKIVGYIPNALDFTGADPERRMKHIESDMQGLSDIGLQPELLDLKEYFSKPSALSEKIAMLGGIFVSGGNVFILRQAMRLSRLDTLLGTLKNREDFVYSGYSAAGCVLSLSLREYAFVDDATDLPYPDQRETIWEGLGIIDFSFIPHYDSNHLESDDIEETLQYCIDHALPYKTLRDGEVLVIE